MSEENKEVCPKCGNSDFSIARDMHSTRYCRCGNTWLPKLREENKTVFELNDRVTAFGIEGVVISVDFAKDYPIKVDFYNGKYPTFTKDGKLYNWHLEPSLKLIEKAKNKVNKKFWIYINEKEIKCSHVEAATLYAIKPEKQKNCQLVEIELEVEE